MTPRYTYTHHHPQIHPFVTSYYSHQSQPHPYYPILAMLHFHLTPYPINAPTHQSFYPINAPFFLSGRGRDATCLHPGFEPTGQRHTGVTARRGLLRPSSARGDCDRSDHPLCRPHPLPGRHQLQQFHPAEVPSCRVVGLLTVPPPLPPLLSPKPSKAR